MISTAKTALIMAGGTGGHIMPALAVAEALRAKGWQVVWLGTESGMEARLVSERGFDLVRLTLGGVRGKGALRMVLLPMQLLLAFAQAIRWIRRVRPHVAIGFGGYPAFPGGVMASLLGRPLVIHEQNAIAGLSNRVLACLADRVLLGLPGAFQGGKDRPLPCGKVNTEWVGNPVRAAIATLDPPARRMAGREGPLRLLVVGGSLGAVALNTLVPRALGRIAPDARPVVRHQSGAQHIDALRAAYATAGVEAECIDFIADMAEALAWADVVLCRAGASTLAELTVAGAAAALVPFPHAVDDHQTANARVLATAGAAWLLPQEALSETALATWIGGLTRAELIARADKARALGKPAATARVVEVIEEVAQ